MVLARAIPRVSLACLQDVMRIFTSSSPTLVSAVLPFVKVRPLTNMVTACNNSRVVRLALLVLRLDKASLGSCMCVIASSPSSVMTVFRRLLLCPINHILLISGIFLAPAPSLPDAGLSTGNNTRSFFNISVIALASALASSQASQPLRASANSCALRASRSPSGVLRASSLRPGLLPLR